MKSIIIINLLNSEHNNVGLKYIVTMKEGRKENKIIRNKTISVERKY